MIINNKFLGAILGWVFRRKLKTLSFTYEKSYYDDDIVWWQFKANYIKELRKQTEEFIAQIKTEDTDAKSDN